MAITSRIVILVAALCVSFGQANAWRAGQATSNGKTVINVGGGEMTAQTFINVLNAAGSIAYSGGATPAAQDAYMYPVRNFSGLIGGHLGGEGSISTTGPYVFFGDAGRGNFRITFTSPIPTVTNIPACVTVTNNGTFNATIQADCNVAWSMTINFATAGTINAYFVGSDATFGSYSNWNLNTSGRMALVRQSDLVAYNNGGYWTLEFVSYISGLRPKFIRPMGLNSNAGYGQTGSNVINWKYRRTTDSLWFVDATSDFPPGARCGGSTSFCTMAVSAQQVTSAAADDTPLSSWVDGEQISGTLASALSPMAISGVTGSTGATSGNCKITVADTTNLSVSMPVTIGLINGATECNAASTTILSVDSSTQFTINVAKGSGTYTSSGYVGYQTLTITGKSGGAKIIWQLDNSAPINTGSVSGKVTFTYNSVLDIVLVSSGGITNSIPLEAQAQLANRLGAGFWYNPPIMASDDFISRAANVIYNNLNSNLKFAIEPGNELFNPGAKASHFAFQMGSALGIGTNLEFQGLRNRQIFGNIIPATSWGSSLDRVSKMYCVQATAVGTGVTNPMSGTTLISPGSAAYQAYVGGSAVNYNTSPDRPVDKTTSLCYAPYLGGGTALSGQSPDALVAPTSYDAPNLNTIIAAKKSGDTTTANATIDGLIRGDVLSKVQSFTWDGSNSRFQTPLAHNLDTNSLVRLTVSGGSACSSLNLLSMYKVLSVPTSTSFTVGEVVNGVTQSAVSACAGATGTMSVGYLNASSGTYGNKSIFGLMSGVFTKFQNIAVNGFSPAPAGGSLAVSWYEGAMQPSAPTAAQCTAIGISTSGSPSDCDQIGLALTDWKNSSLALATTLFYDQTFMGTAAGTITSGAMSQSVAPSWLGLIGNNVYSLQDGSVYVSPSLYQTYYGIQNFGMN